MKPHNGKTQMTQSFQASLDQMKHLNICIQQLSHLTQHILQDKKGNTNYAFTHMDMGEGYNNNQYIILEPNTFSFSIRINGENVFKNGIKYGKGESNGFKVDTQDMASKVIQHLTTLK